MLSLSLGDFKNAAERLAPYIRKTPLLDLEIAKGQTVSCKLENLQVSGSFKVRGALNTVLTLSEEQLKRGLVTASGGNHGMGVAYAGALTNTPTTIYLPENTPASKVAKLKKLTPDVIVSGPVWDDANALALKDRDANGKTYIHPFADETVIQGQGTIALEVLEAAPHLDTLLVAIGGGGLISGVAYAAKLINPNIRIIGIEATGAPTLHDSLKAGELVTLDAINTRAGTLAPRRSETPNFEIISKNVDQIVLVEDDMMEDAAKWLWESAGIAVELSAAAAIAALQHNLIPSDTGNTGVIICGAGTDGIPK
ncbi:pyridoxal-phosphate dependent enzyme [Sneathiella sp. P13V-1]|uniref:threonine ammonia-lyase n=1 Tax=Sneathiella sp. P13V-1 TaxID=2697366 RepID=UPI00187B9557|nr:threonine/serine dehydratase [Sneathiella sp. P13V-1]MBE7635365.1 pyridoxal-phosphate dependent enzyme [Sneathiella sp. P13V-1]